MDLNEYEMVYGVYDVQCERKDINSVFQSISTEFYVFYEFQITYFVDIVLKRSRKSKSIKTYV